MGGSSLEGWSLEGWALEGERLGWSPFFANQPAVTSNSSWRPYRVSTRQRDRFHLLGAGEPIWASARGRLFESGELPAVGDWVLVARPADGDAVIEQVLERQSVLVRQAAGKRTESQIIAANLDVVFIVCSANDELNVRRIERYMTAIWDGGAKPVIVVNKADLAEDRDALIDALGDVAQVAPIALTCATAGDVDEIRAHLSADPPTTTAFVGSSGVGKSTLINALFGEEIQKTQPIRETDGKGRHTTTSRELFVSSTAGILIDTPGMRELALWEGEAGVGVTFREIEEHAALCRFGDCQHESEPGCAVKAALADGSISVERLESYRKLVREIAHHERERTAASRHAERISGKKFAAVVKAHKKRKGG